MRDISNLAVGRGLAPAAKMPTNLHDFLGRRNASPTMHLDGSAPRHTKNGRRCGVRFRDIRQSSSLGGRSLRS